MIRWLLSHTFLILLIVIVIYGYMFWGNLLGNSTPAGKAIAYLSSEFVEVAEFVNAVKAKQARLNGKGESEPNEPRTSDVVASKTVPLDDTPVEPKAMAVTETQPVVASDEMAATKNVGSNEVTAELQKESISTTNQPSDGNVESGTAALTESQGNVVRDEAQSEGSEASVVAAEVVKENDTDTAETFVSPEIERQLDNVDDQGQVVDALQSNDIVKANWITARKSFYQRNYDLSEQNYQKVIANTEDNFDAYGELGNVYFNQGKKQQAATVYFKSAAILVRKGQIDRARSMVGLLNLLDKDKASQLQQLIDSALS